MKSSAVFRRYPFFLLLLIFLFTACSSATVLPTPAPTPTSTLAPTASPQPAAGLPLISLEEYGYQFRYPAQYQVVIYENRLCLTPVQTFGLPGPCHVQNFSMEVVEAGGRSLREVADALAAEGNPDIEVKRTSLAVSGEEAFLLDDIYTYDVLRKVVVVHDGRAYIMTFVPWGEGVDGFPQLEELYNTVIDSFAFLPQPESLLPSTSTPVLFVVTQPGDMAHED